MSIKQKIIVTTADTKERIEFPGDKKWGDVWQLEIGLEINPEYVAISRKRMAQQLLFGAEG